jgi:hypothetical protein
MQQILGGMQEDYRRLAHVFNKLAITNFPLHEVETKEHTQDSSAAKACLIPVPLWDAGELL